jgi:ATP-dependent Lon protease
MSVFKKKIDIVSHATKITSDVNPSGLQEIVKLIKIKMFKIQEIIQRILKTLNSYRGLEIISNSDLIVCTSTLIECFNKSSLVNSQLELQKNYTVDKINEYIDQLQQIVDKMSIIMCGYGAYSIDDIFFISFGSSLEQSAENSTESDLLKEKRNLILKYVRPIGYKTFHWKQSRIKPKNTSDSCYLIDGSFNICIDKIVEDTIQIELANQYECFDIDLTEKTNYVKIYGIRLVVHNEKTQKTLIIQGLVDDIPIDSIENGYINHRKKEINEIIRSLNSSNEKMKSDILEKVLDTMTIKDALVNGNQDFIKKVYSIITDANFVKINKLTSTIKKFLDMDNYGQRSMIMNLLTYNKEDEVQYITYLLYDLISAKNSNGSTVDSSEQQIIYDSFPWKIKLYFKETMKHTIKYTKDMISKYDVNRISLEQQIYVMKVPENIKEKAMAKLKEIKGKSDDSGAKAKQYLEGLLKIPFGVYREESILKKTKKLNAMFVDTIHNLNSHSDTSVFFKTQMNGKFKTHYSAMEIVKLCDLYEKWSKNTLIDYLVSNIPSYNTKQINQIWNLFNVEFNTDPNSEIGLSSNKKSSISKQNKERILKSNLNKCNETTLSKMVDSVLIDSQNSSIYQKTLTDLKKAKAIANEFKYDLKNIVNILDDSIHGHESAKNQIIKIIGQWMNGEQSGYCFGFEGSPGVGKTSLAKRGLAKCLKDENGSSRPFAFIALGGSCNGSTLEGHSYTYVNSTWGRIVDILMDSKCLNPIIYIDELDKVSKTEHGKEIIGILMHLIDTTQNNGFQDKYFSGIDVDLSKALFIFSYNDASQIDSILLDRIHRIKFDNLSLEEKIVIARKYILPETNKKMGIDGCVELSDEIIAHIIETYTLESGVRKLKEVLFDLYGEINIELLRCENSTTTELPIVITVESLENKYLAKYDKMRETKIHTTPQIGIINGLWANSLGRGGIIPIQVVNFPTSTFLELRLTGMQGDVMKESMNVAKSLAWSLLTEKERVSCLERFEKTKEQGIHIHCPDGSTPKDGPSAGAAITSAIYSLLSGKLIRNDIAMTGEINLQGKITEIGGLEQKIFGGIRAGIKTFLYPSANKQEFNKFMQKYNNNVSLNGIKFKSVSEIREAFNELRII